MDRKRITQPEIRRFVELLEGLTIHQDSLPVAGSVSKILPLAREYGLSAYDASYLEMAIRRNVPLATMHRELERAGRKAGGRSTGAGPQKLKMHFPPSTTR
jgi:predicted nucleic acid-binding protein